MVQISIHFLQHMFRKHVRNNSHPPRYFDFLANSWDGCTNGFLHYLSSKNYSMNCFGKPNEPKAAMLTKISTWQMLKIGHWIWCFCAVICLHVVHKCKSLRKSVANCCEKVSSHHSHMWFTIFITYFIIHTLHSQTLFRNFKSKIDNVQNKSESTINYNATKSK